MKRMNFAFKPQSKLGITSTKVLVYASNRRLVGYIEEADISAFQNGERVASFQPVRDWKTQFSIGLMVQLRLPLPIDRGVIGQ